MLIGGTSILVGVYGPADCKESKQDVKQAVVEVNFRPKIGIPGLAEKYYEQYIRGICEAAILRSWHPRTLFAIIVQVMQDKGSVSLLFVLVHGENFDENIRVQSFCLSTAFCGIELSIS